jgi:hypothetical protein
MKIIIYLLQDTFFNLVKYSKHVQCNYVILKKNVSGVHLNSSSVGSE